MLHPDLILFTGDAIDESGNIQVLRDFLDLLDDEIPKDAVLGNHEYKAGVNKEELQKLYQHHNGYLLVNESKLWHIKGKRLLVTGLDDLIHGQHDVEKAFQHPAPAKNHLLLIHSPLHQEKVQE
ncbi:metallophosphoesterase [Telluribacter humicola]|uniref:metallophosphoesterase n=1 Tax=Telluribacter humicola TaxID=1720261 RepID=UPI001A974F51|nr:metallophosphoesterase [Telluribacter humicola]